MTYAETLDYMFNALPMFQRIGAAAFRKDLSNTLKLCNHLNNPEKSLKTIHVGGTNGKGSTSHLLASILMQAGYKVGLYTSPHLKSFTERIKVNGQEISEDAVISFVTSNKVFLDELKPSFFEMTVGLAFWYFSKQEVDIAIIEVGMGGRLDSTNVIEPELSVITTIGYDHVQFLGDTLPQIAGEKAGIIKKNTPIIISHSQSEVKAVFEQKASEKSADLYFADEFFKVTKLEDQMGFSDYLVKVKDLEPYKLSLQLMGDYQVKNMPGVLCAVTVLRDKGWVIPHIAVVNGCLRVIDSTGLKGRWQKLADQPMMLCDTGHNEDGIRMILQQLARYSYQKLWMVLGMVNDKDISKVLRLLPQNAKFIFCEAKIPRAMSAQELGKLAESLGISGEIIPDVNGAIDFAKKNADKEDLIFIGGSTFVVAEINDL